MTTSAEPVPALARALAKRGYDTLTPVQEAMLAEANAGRDLLVSAQTGSGKTVAFGLAIAPTLLGSGDEFGVAGTPLALVVAPTRELALQVKREFEWLYGEAGVRIASAVGGMDMRAERRTLDHGAHIVVGTPGRLRDHITRGSLDIASLRAVVLDEADEMLDLGFREDLEFILSAAPAERRTLLFSATLPKPIVEMARRFQHDALRIAVKGRATQHEDIDYQILLVAPTDRENAVVNALLFYDAANTLVFCSTRESVRHLTSRLSNRGFPVVSLSGELSQAERNNALQAMRDGRARVCIATDVAARGLDLPGLDLVVHADLPSSAETLLHRSGRTGRAGRKGICALIVPFHRRRSADRLLKTAKLEAETKPAPGVAEVAARERARLLEDETLTLPAAADDADLVRDLLAAHGAEQIAAAYIRQVRRTRPLPEELSDAPQPDIESWKGERPETRFTGGSWFRISLGRRDRAEPRWLLPLICRAGQTTRSAVGSIRILERETRFEIASDLADAFERAVQRPGGVEKGARITRLSDASGDEAIPARDAAPRPAPGGGKPASKERFGKGKPPFGSQKRPKEHRKGKKSADSQRRGT